MTEYIKQFISNPTVLFLFVALGTIWLAVMFQIIAKQKLLPVVEKYTLFVLLLIVSRLNIFPFDSLSIDKIFKGLATTGSFYTSAIVFPLIVYFCLCCILIKSLRNFPMRIWEILKKDLFITSLILWSLVSTLWSATPLTTLFASLLFTIATLVTAYFGEQYDLSTLITLLRWNSTTIVLASIIVALLFPSIGIDGKGWRGILGHPIPLGQVCAFTSTLWYIQIFENSKYRIRSIVLLFLSIITLSLTSSATSILTSMSSIFISSIMIFIRKFKFRQAVTVIFPAMLLGIVLAIFIKSNVDGILASLGKNPELSGRTGVWSALSPAIEQRFLFGYGYAGFWQPWLGQSDPSLVFKAGLPFEPTSAHNGFIELSLELGVIGLLLFVFSFISSLLKAIYLQSNSSKCEFIVPTVFLVNLLISNNSGSYLLAFTGIGWIWFYYVLFSLNINARKNLMLEKMYLHKTGLKSEHRVRNS